MTPKGFSLILVLIGAVAINGENQEGKLIHHVLHHYNTMVRPVQSHEDAIKVNLSIMLVKLDPFPSETEDVMKTTAFTVMKWSDEKLKWNPEDYDGIKEVRIPVRKLWLPDIAVWNSVGQHEFRNAPSGDVVAYNDGRLVWVPASRMVTHCTRVVSSGQNRDSTTQSCYLKFGSWAYSGLQLDLELEDPTTAIDKSQMMKNRCWRLDGDEAKRHEIVYPCCPENYIDVTFTFNFTNICE